MKFVSKSLLMAPGGTLILHTCTVQCMCEISGEFCLIFELSVKCLKFSTARILDV